jgi:hypothetical protein
MMYGGIAHPQRPANEIPVVRNLMVFGFSGLAVQMEQLKQDTSLAQLTNAFADPMLW